MLFGAFASVEPARRLLELIAAVGAPVIVYSWFEEQEQVDAVLALGAAGFLPKSASALEIVAAVEDVHDHRPAEGRPTSRPPNMSAWPGQDHRLSPREAEVLAYIAQGLSNQDIAERCYLSINSVKTYIRTAYQKIGVTSRSRAVLWAVQHGFLTE